MVMMGVDQVGPEDTCPSFGKHEWQEESDVLIDLLRHEIILADVKIATRLSRGDGRVSGCTASPPEVESVRESSS